MAIKRVFSAGGIVLRRFTPQDKFEVLITQHSGHKGWDFPKGHIEKGESSQDAAIREVKEETGIVAKVIKKLGDVKYFYYEGKEKVFKTVIYFLMEYQKQGEATTAFEVSDLKWLPKGKVFDQLSFDSTRKFWDKVKGEINV